MFFRISVLENFAIFTENHLCWSLFQSFPVNVAKILRTAFIIEHLVRLFLTLPKSTMELVFFSYFKPLTLFRIGEAKSPPPTSFSPVTSTNVRINPQNFLTFSVNPFYHIGVQFQGYTLCRSKIIELEPRTPLKKSGFSGQILIKLSL